MTEIMKGPDSPWSLPIVIIQENSNLLFYMNYKKLKNVTRNSFLLPSINDTLGMLTGASGS
jgi:hypothetical protein